MSVSKSEIRVFIQKWRFIKIKFSCVLILKLRLETHLCEFYFLLVKHEKSFGIHEEFDENQRSMSRKQTCPSTCQSKWNNVRSVSKLRDHWSSVKFWLNIQKYVWLGIGISQNRHFSLYFMHPCQEIFDLWYYCSFICFHLLLVQISELYSSAFWLSNANFKLLMFSFCW